MTSLAPVPGTLVFPRFVVCPGQPSALVQPWYLLPTVRPRSAVRVCTAVLQRGRAEMGRDKV